MLLLAGITTTAAALFNSTLFGFQTTKRAGCSFDREAVARSDNSLKLDSRLGAGSRSRISNCDFSNDQKSAN